MSFAEVIGFNENGSCYKLFGGWTLNILKCTECFIMHVPYTYVSRGTTIILQQEWIRGVGSITGYSAQERMECGCWREDQPLTNHRSLYRSILQRETLEPIPWSSAHMHRSLMYRVLPSGGFDFSFGLLARIQAGNFERESIKIIMSSIECSTPQLLPKLYPAPVVHTLIVRLSRLLHCFPDELLQLVLVYLIYHSQSVSL